jgi:hypothetical protein
VSHEAVPGIFDLLAIDGFGIIGAVGFFVPAALLIVIVVGAVVRDRRLAAREAAAEAYETGLKREEFPARPPAEELSDSKGRKKKMPAKPTTDSAKAMESRGGQRGSMRRR